jgi:hypothetical protein
MTAQTFALIAGIAYVGAGVLGLLPATLMPAPADAPATRFDVLYGYLLGLFPVNVLHTGVHLAIGLWGIAAWAGAAGALTYARSLAVIYGLLAVMGIIPGLNTVFGLIPLHGHDIWLHGVTAAVAAYFGFRSADMPRERRGGPMDRRQAARPVAAERRVGAPDRRRAGYAGMTQGAA